MGCDDERVLMEARKQNHNPVGGIVDGMIMCLAGDGTHYYICDPREEPGFDGSFYEGCFVPFGGY